MNYFNIKLQKKIIRELEGSRSDFKKLPRYFPDRPSVTNRNDLYFNTVVHKNEYSLFKK